MLILSEIHTITNSYAINPSVSPVSLEITPVNAELDTLDLNLDLNRRFIKSKPDRYTTVLNP